MASILSAVIARAELIFLASVQADNLTPTGGFAAEIHAVPANCTAYDCPWVKSRRGTLGPASGAVKPRALHGQKCSWRMRSKGATRMPNG